MDIDHCGSIDFICGMTRGGSAEQKGERGRHVARERRKVQFREEGNSNSSLRPARVSAYLAIDAMAAARRNAESQKYGRAVDSRDTRRALSHMIIDHDRSRYRNPQSGECVRHESTPTTDCRSRGTSRRDSRR
jgi:hypothetical protein